MMIRSPVTRQITSCNDVLSITVLHSEEEKGDWLSLIDKYEPSVQLTVWKFDKSSISLVHHAKIAHPSCLYGACSTQVLSKPQLL